MNEEFPYYTPTQAGAKADESPMTIRRRIEAGILKAVNTTSGTFIKKEDLDNYLQRRGPKQGRKLYRKEDLVEEPEDETLYEDAGDGTEVETTWTPNKGQGFGYPHNWREGESP